MDASAARRRPEGHGTKNADSSTNYNSKDDVQIVTHNTAASISAAPWSFTPTDFLTLLGITLMAILVRCYKLSSPGEVVFDEVHFGKFAGKYLNGTYFYDLHPPLAKMMFAAAGKLAGYDGVFDFKSIGLNYAAAGVPYVGMRLMPALLGALTVPATYVTARACGYAVDTGVLAALLVCFENGLVTQSRLILLDSPLVFFTVLTLTAWAVFWTKQREPFSCTWWFWLTATGAMMGCAASCKWVGLFLFPIIGLSTVSDLWAKIADRSLSPARWACHFLARAVGLLLCPWPLRILVPDSLCAPEQDRLGRGMMTPEFQTTLAGGLNVSTDRDVFYGSEIRLRTTNARSGYLHSHAHLWQHSKGSGQQQVTIYGHADANNLWVVEPSFNRTVDESKGPVPVRGGETIRLKHKITGKYLHSHDKRPAMTSSDTKFELSGYGFKDFAGDSNDDFTLEILAGDSRHPGSEEQLQAIYSRFRLIHRNLQCAVYNSRKKLPKWAFEQIEVNCMRNCMPRMSTWHVEFAQLPELVLVLVLLAAAGAAATADQEDVPKAAYVPLGLWGKVLEYNRLMADSNAGLTGDHPFAARPQHWAWLRRGTAYWGGRGSFIYQLGNPLIWWGSLAPLFSSWPPGLGGQRAKYFASAGFFTVAWICHYAPFFFMGRELFIHHMFPALWMSILVLAFTLDLFTARVPAVVRMSVYVAVAAAVLYAFQTFSYITYARTWTKDACVKAKWLSTWDFDCEHAIGGVRSTEPPLAPVAPVDREVKAVPVDAMNADDDVAAEAEADVDVGDIDAIVELVEEAAVDVDDGVVAPEIGEPYAVVVEPVEQETVESVYVEPMYENPTVIKPPVASVAKGPESVVANLGQQNSNQMSTGSENPGEGHAEL
ncbi:Dolichyl-phosphate-mannose-protein mannosyltransferase-domain-containing protein [Kickxella alabastrina]|uniref:Dolichyl-phosphate-mannose-protein mannosyltransferase-domain-containing protein n=1 Tax=Kickxella alabastrina TaxID=61397 RepID=UPI00222007BD|nr:Dolichyl-phosphate-mannose-protein mannosyltransferase-domain-containing protein [Kickxella alabastrina]KAI7831049.1 Dolichyl-phosphate-mannose-protein mannosyltransferase-domain-containing protein [Kickxella alabastrina]